jgi:hypothetical protein
MAEETKYPQTGAERNGQAENWGQPLGGADFLLSRPGGCFNRASIRPWSPARQILRERQTDNAAIQQRNRLADEKTGELFNSPVVTDLSDRFSG